MKKALCIIAFFACLSTLGFGTSFAGDYPDGPISMIVCYNPGGATDFQARIVTMFAQEHLGQPIVVINKPGAGGQVGWNWFVQKGSKDGYTITAYNMPHFIAQSMVYKTEYDINSFEPVGNWGADPAVLIVPQDSDFNSVKDLVDYAKENPGKVTINGAGLYVGHHIAALQLQKATDVKFTYIPETGGTPAMQNVISGKVKAGFNNLADAYRNKDRVKILAVADLERHEYLPDTPTLMELGFDVDDSSVNFRGIALPAGAPQDVIDKCSEVFLQMFKDPKVASKMNDSGSPMRILDAKQVKNMFAKKQEALKVLLGDLKK